MVNVSAVLVGYTHRPDDAQYLLNEVQCYTFNDYDEILNGNLTDQSKFSSGKWRNDQLILYTIVVHVVSPLSLYFMCTMIQLKSIHIHNDLKIRMY